MNRWALLAITFIVLATALIVWLTIDLGHRALDGTTTASTTSTSVIPLGMRFPKTPIVPTTTTTATTTTAAPPAPAVTDDGIGWPFGPLADCESGTWDATQPYGVVAGSRNWADRRGGYEGGLHFHPNTWDAYRLPDMPASAADATPEQQITVAIRVRDGADGLTAQGWAAWPTCSRRIGAR